MKQLEFYGPALKEALIAAGVENFAELSRNLGLGDGYLSNAISRNSIAVTVAKQIHAKYGIDFEQLKAPKPEKVPEQMAFELNRPELTPESIYKAVYAAIIHANRDIEKEKIRNAKSN